MKMKIILFLVIIIMSSSCSLVKDELDGADVYTTSYPIYFLTETLYGDYSTINSIYPSDAILNDYELTSKQIKNYADGDLFIYNGLTSEKNIAKDFIEKNNGILLIDSAHSLTIENNIEELWLSPNNYLMLAKNIKDNLIEYIENQYIHDTINTNYNSISEILSLMDADLRSIGKNAQNNIFVTSSNSFKFLENYGFNIISLEDTSKTDSMEQIKDNLENNKYAGIIVKSDERTEFIENLNEVNIIEIKSLNNADLENDYISLMNEFIANIQAATLK